MLLRKITAPLILILLIILLIALAFFNAGSTEVNNEGYVSSAHITDAEPELWSQLGLQLHYAPEDEKAAVQFLENVAVELQAKGISKVFILPEYIDISEAAENLEGVFIFHFNLESSGWQLSRQGKVRVSAEYFPLKQEVLTQMNAGTTVSATGRGWFNQANFTKELLDSAAEYWVQEVLRSFKLPNNQLTENNEIRNLASSLEQIPAFTSNLMPDNAEPVAFFMHHDNYLLSYLTGHDELENFLNRELTGRQNMEIVLPWVDAVGGRRMTELQAADGSQTVTVNYADTASIPYTSGYEPFPRSQEILGEYLVTIAFTKQ
ncbi:MAG: hypothetical protein ACQES4_10175 [Bacillota bacterium]